MALPNKAQRKQLESYVKKCQASLNLTHWELQFFYKEKGSYHAAINVISSTCTAHLTITNKFWQDSPALKRWTIAHELLHLYTNEMVQAIHGSFRDFVPKNSWQPLISSFDHQEEIMVDRLSKILAEQLPEWE